MRWWEYFWLNIILLYPSRWNSYIFQNASIVDNNDITGLYIKKDFLIINLNCNWKLIKYCIAYFVDINDWFWQDNEDITVHICKLLDMLIYMSSNLQIWTSWWRRRHQNEKLVWVMILRKLWCLVLVTFASRVIAIVIFSSCGPVASEMRQTLRCCTVCCRDVTLSIGLYWVGLLSWF